MGIFDGCCTSADASSAVPAGASAGLPAGASAGVPPTPVSAEQMAGATQELAAHLSGQTLEQLVATAKKERVDETLLSAAQASPLAKQAVIALLVGKDGSAQAVRCAPARRPLPTQLPSAPHTPTLTPSGTCP